MSTFTAYVYMYLCITISLCDSEKTFLVSFQTEGKISTEAWMKYKENITGIDEEFSACHWERIRYFAVEVNAIWAYCFIFSESDINLKCIQIYHYASTSAKRNVDLGIHLEVVTGNVVTVASVMSHSIPYRHREWNHICFTYSSIKNVTQFYYNGKPITTERSNNIKNLPRIFSDKSLFKSTFTVAQEPDNITGGYSPMQLFNGEISELNLWGEMIHEIQIIALANCSSNTKGDVVAWEKQRFVINKADVREINNNALFCEPQNTFAIFPQRTAYLNSKNLCEIHGGKLVVPTSDADQKKILNILSRHKRACIDTQNELLKGKAIWLGMERKRAVWYKADSINMFRPINFTKWNPDGCTKENCGLNLNLSCPYMEENGLWAFGLKSYFCIQIELCTICSFGKAPVFSVKGMCSEDTQLDWNYYIYTDDKSQIVGYNGYKSAKLRRNNSIWKLQDDGVVAETSADYPVGRQNWDYKDRRCGMQSAVNTSLTFSTCFPGKEFTCGNGMCIPLSKRCNHVHECEDNSDEEHCHLVRIPSSYNKLLSPGTYRPIDRPVTLFTKIHVISIDLIDTIQMRIELTFDTQIKWSDDLLKFENMGAKGRSRISVASQKKLWTPLENIVHINSVVGGIIKDKNTILKVLNLTKGMSFNTIDSFENYIHLGKHSQLVFSQRFKVAYRCNFDVTKFPFDTHRCYFKMQLALQKDDSLVFAKDGTAVYYEGPSTWNQFQIQDIRSKVITEMETTNFIFSLRVSRVYMNQMLNIFLPIILLWSLAYFTMFIDLENFSDRFIGSVTTLLVLVALLSSVNEDLPKTSYFKFIDLWFLWNISSILLITLFHICISHIPNNQIRSQSFLAIRNDEGVQNRSLRYKINRVGVILFGIGMIIFLATYYHYSI